MHCFLWALPLWFLVHFQRLNVASCHCSCHGEGCCAASADMPCTFSLPTFNLLAFSIILYSPCPHDRLLCFWPWPTSLINPNCLSLGLQQLSWHLIPGHLCENWLELAHGLSLCVSSHGRFPRVKIEWIKPECGWSSCAFPHHKCSQLLKRRWKIAPRITYH